MDDDYGVGKLLDRVARLEQLVGDTHKALNKWSLHDEDTAYAYAVDEVSVSEKHGGIALCFQVGDRHVWFIMDNDAAGRASGRLSKLLRHINARDHEAA